MQLWKRFYMLLQGRNCQRVRGYGKVSCGVFTREEISVGGARRGFLASRRFRARGSSVATVISTRVRGVRGRVSGECSGGPRCGTRVSTRIRRRLHVTTRCHTYGARRRVRRLSEGCKMRMVRWGRSNWEALRGYGTFLLY